MPDSECLTFDEWCQRVDEFMKDIAAIDYSVTDETGREHWREAFEDGTSPERACADEIAYGQ